jgi:adenosylmethionine-8-amino-7-oxononanoate aminotransferase
VTKQYLLNVDLNRDFPQAVRGQGIHLYDADGKQYLDGCSGALVANIGHGVSEIIEAMKKQAESLAYVYRVHFSSPAAEELASRLCHMADKPLDRVYFTNSGSEAAEMAVKLARMRHLAAGEHGRYKIISRWQSYHGITMGALSWSGITSRRAEYQDYFKEFVHIPPAYCYRCWYGLSSKACQLECARALENAILTEGPTTISAFIAEPVVGAALAAAVPPARYFQAIRDICDRYGVLFITDDIMTGAGRTGGKYFASDHFSGQPDMVLFGKGVGGGYYPVAGVLITKAVGDVISAGSGHFVPSQSHSAHPLGMAVGLAVLDYMHRHDLVHRSYEMGLYLEKSLKDLLHHSLVGDIRGLGLMWGLEFVQDRGTKEPFDPKLQIYKQVYEAAKKQGLLLLPSYGCDRGHAGDMALIGPPLTITREQIDDLVYKLDAVLTQVERES